MVVRSEALDLEREHIQNLKESLEYPIAKTADAISPHKVNTADLMVSQDFFRELFVQMENESKAKYGKMIEQVRSYHKKNAKFAKIADRAFPEVQAATRIACAEAKRVNKALHIGILRKAREYRLRDLWRALKKNTVV